MRASVTIVKSLPLILRHLGPRRPTDGYPILSAASIAQADGVYDCYTIYAFSLFIVFRLNICCFCSGAGLCVDVQA